VEQLWFLPFLLVLAKKPFRLHGRLVGTYLMAISGLAVLAQRQA